MNHDVSTDDDHFIADFESGRLTPAQLDHRAHVRAAYVYLANEGSDAATARMRATLLAFIEHHGIDASKYHETLTHAWILAVRHHMEVTPGTASADQFIDANPQLLDSAILLTHYSAELLYSPEARAGFVEPDRSPIPGSE